jgi:hypothetical protein
MISRFCLVAMAGIVFSATSPEAQESDVRNPVYEMARNKIGLLRYCRDKGLIDRTLADEALDVEERGLATITAMVLPYNKRAGDDAEKRGETGIYGSGSRQPIANMARVFNTTPEGLCKEWSEDSMMVLKAMRLRGADPKDAASPGGPSRQ